MSQSKVYLLAGSAIALTLGAAFAQGGDAARLNALQLQKLISGAVESIATTPNFRELSEERLETVEIQPEQFNYEVAPTLRNATDLNIMQLAQFRKEVISHSDQSIGTLTIVESSKDYDSYDDANVDKTVYTQAVSSDERVDFSNVEAGAEASGVVWASDTQYASVELASEYQAVEKPADETHSKINNARRVGPSPVRDGNFEELPEVHEIVRDTSFDRLQNKRALIGNRFSNGSKHWNEIGNNFERASKAAQSFDMPNAYRQEVSYIGKSTRQQKIDPAIWRGNRVSMPLGIGDGTVNLSLQDALAQASVYAAQIAVFRELPAIRETSVQEAKGRFKPEVFAEARYEDRDIPTTSLAQTAGDDRLREDDFATEFGIRKRVRSGAEVTLSQRFNTLETNLIEFDPSEQSRSRTVLSIRQPLLRDSGFSFNRALENIAKLETDVAVEEFRRQSESHLLEVTRAYWNLYLARVAVQQETASVARLSKVVERVSGRRGIDAQQLQVTRARAAEAEQKSSLVRARNTVRNAEARLRALINSPEMRNSQTMEIVPVDVPATVWVDHQFEQIVGEAVDHRPEVKQAYLQHKASVLRKGVAANEALPQLDLIAEGSLNGREDNFNFGGAFRDANEGDYVVGMRFSMPIGRDERKARHKRRRLEELQQRRQVETTLTTIQLEAEISMNEFAVAYEEYQQRKEAVSLATKDLEILEERWRRGVGNNGVVFLDMLIDANKRSVDAQKAFAQSLVTFKYAEANLDRARGRFLQERGFKISRSVDRNGTPAYTLERV